ncbi:pentatricopeptide repeat-containing protein At3g61360-like [Phoenix dactylifera]|uniref:Pentatricopeptide repeat-containing protein At3g61360-like n=1 Tax=Phoenix dactylifera TaxID=42345 RepID=A0A8B8ZRT5_PHODC|nr:pentatricopeptide repeat-containing protein At3g61360-like [Phoenix dactylifera]
MNRSENTAAPTTTTTSLPQLPSAAAVDRLAKLISNHPLPLRPLLLRHFPSSLLLEPLLRRLFAGHALATKALDLFRFSLHHHHHPPPSPYALSTTLHHLSRARDFDSSFALLEDVARSHPSLLSPKPLAVLLSRLAKFRPLPEALDAFDRAERTWALAGLAFGADEFNALLRAFCSQGLVAEARAVFRQLHHRFPPNARTLNTLLLGFKESGHLVALDLFYHDMLARGFEPDAVTYCIRIDAYCKKGQFFDALELVDEMTKKNCTPTVQTMTTLIHGAGIVKNPLRARRLFDEMGERGLSPDRGAYNALLGSYTRVGDLKSAMELLDEMEAKRIGLDDVSYYTLFCGFKRLEELDGFWKLYRRMVEREFVPRTRTVMLLMKVFCENGRADLGLELWNYLVDKGCCPHRHALDLLVTGLCCRGRVEEAYHCFRQMVDRASVPSERAFRVLEGFLMQGQEMEKVEELGRMMKGVQAFAPSSC